MNLTLLTTILQLTTLGYYLNIHLGTLWSEPRYVRSHTDICPVQLFIPLNGTMPCQLHLHNKIISEEFCDLSIINDLDHGIVNNIIWSPQWTLGIINEQLPLLFPRFWQILRSGGNFTANVEFVHSLRPLPPHKYYHQLLNIVLRLNFQEINLQQSMYYGTYCWHIRLHKK